MERAVNLCVGAGGWKWVVFCFYCKALSVSLSMGSIFVLYSLPILYTVLSFIHLALSIVNYLPHLLMCGSAHFI